MSIISYVSYVILTFTVVYSPGPMTMFLMNNGMQYGLRRTLPALYGASTAYALAIIVFAFGLSSFFNHHLVWLESVKYLGAGYMLYLAATKWINRSKPIVASDNLVKQSKKSLYWGGVITGLSNPKAILLFGIIFPQFLFKSKNLVIDCSILGITYLLLQFSSGCCYCYFGQQIKHVLKDPKFQTKINQVVAIVFVIVAILFASISVP